MQRQQMFLPRMAETGVGARSQWIKRSARADSSIRVSTQVASSQSSKAWLHASMAGLLGAPRLANTGDNVVVVLADAIAEIRLLQVLPHVFRRMQLGRCRGDTDNGQIARYLKLGRRVPAGSIHEHDRMGVGEHCGTDPGQVVYRQMTSLL